MKGYKIDFTASTITITADFAKKMNTPQQIMYAVRNKMIQEYEKRKMAKAEPEITEFKITSEVKVK